MINPGLYRNSRLYDFFMKSLGYESSIDRFLGGLTLHGTAPRRILDAGCGTGLLGLHFLQRFPEAELVATDLEPNFLSATLENADRREIARDRIAVGIADISDPKRLTSPDDGSLITLADESFDLVCVGAVVGYARDPEDCLHQLLQLLAPGGHLINIEMNESPTGRFVSHRYHYRNITLDRLQQVIRHAGCEATAIRLSLKYFPAMLTRAAVIARKTVPSAVELPRADAIIGP